MKTWVVGRGGLLGSALARRTPDDFLAEAIPWSMPADASSVLNDQFGRFQDACGENSWQILWVAGRATTSATDSEAESELVVLRSFVETLQRSTAANRGALFLASSAGAAYAGSVDAPFTDVSPTHPLSAYGVLKLAQEEAVADLQGVMPVVVGRISNLYGPGQDLSKPQGLISRLAICALTQQPINVFVSLDTLRDYVHVDDAAEQILAWMSLARESERVAASRAVQTRIIASGESVSVGHVIRLTQTIVRRRIPVALGADRSATAHGLDIRLVPSTDERMPRLSRTPLPVGIRSVIADVMERRRTPRPLLTREVRSASPEGRAQ